MKSVFLFLMFLNVFFVSPAFAVESVTVAVSANLRETFGEIQAAFERKTGYAVKTVVGSSGILTAQIQKGAPYDVFLAANMAYPEKLFQAGIGKGKPTPYALGTLALWTKDSLPQGGGLNALSKMSILRLAIANPRFAPYGIEAVKAMEKSGVINSMKGKIIHANSISQVNGYILTSSVEAAITSKSSAISKTLRGKGHWMDIDQSLYDPIEQGALLLKETNAANAFMNFLKSPEGRGILISFGYEVP